MVLSAKSVLVSKVENSTFREMSNGAVCYVAVALDIDLNSQRVYYKVSKI